MAKEITGKDALPSYAKELSGEKQRMLNREAALSQTRLVNLGTNILIHEPPPALVALRRWLNHPANKDIADVVHTRQSFSAMLLTIAAYVGHTINSAATEADAARIMGELATCLQKRAGLRVASENN